MLLVPRLLLLLLPAMSLSQPSREAALSREELWGTMLVEHVHLSTFHR